MKVSIIGSGNVATHIATALHHVNVEVLCIWSQHFENAEALAKRVNATPVSTINDLASISDIIIVAVKDDAISSIANQLANYKGLVAHTSGTVTIQTLNNLENFGVFYPLQTFSKNQDVNFNAVPICLEANTASNLKVLEDLASKISQSVYKINSEKRAVLHVAAVFACNFPNFLFDIAQQLLAQNNLDFNIIRPLILETANKVQQALPNAVQTGPAVRHDINTLTKHEELLKQYSQEWLTIYKVLSEQIKKNR